MCFFGPIEGHVIVGFIDMLKLQIWQLGWEMPLVTGHVYRGDTSQDRCQANSYPYIKQSAPSHRKGLFFTRRSLSCFTLGEFITLRVHSRR